MIKESIIFVYFLIINLAGFFLVLVDKRKSIEGKWRIPEREFFIFTILGAGLGEYISMFLFRHKTKHWSFLIGIPLLSAVSYTLLFLYLAGNY